MKSINIRKLHVELYTTCKKIIIMSLTEARSFFTIIVSGPDKEQDEQLEVPGIASVLQYVDQVQYWLESRRPPICTDYR